LLVPFCEIAVLAVAFYYIILFFRGTRGAQVLYGFALLLIALMVLTNMFYLDALNWVLQWFLGYLAIALVVIFQPEIRRALAELGKQPVFGAVARERSLVDHITKAVQILAERKIGGLIAIERDIATRFIQETGTKLDSLVTPELLASIFFPHTPLHDGGVVIRNNRIVAAGCVFPLTTQSQISKTLGTRHRAAIGLTEETDALVVVVSEETGTISVAYRGRLSRGLDEERLRRVLTSVMHRGGAGRSRISRAREQLDLTPEGLAKTDAGAAEEVDHAG
jgi:diadenylate cyclase